MRLLVILVLVSLTSCASHPIRPQDSIVIVEKEANYEVSVPLSHLTMILPRNGMSLDQNQYGGSMNSPRYFRFENRAKGIILSGWFEPANRYVDLKQGLNVEAENLKKIGFGEPLGLKESSIGIMRTFTFNVTPPSGSSAHIRASYIAAGTWVDIHASVTAQISGEEARQRVSALVKSITFREKP